MSLLRIITIIMYYYVFETGQLGDAGQQMRLLVHQLAQAGRSVSQIQAARDSKVIELNTRA